MNAWQAIRVSPTGRVEVLSIVRLNGRFGATHPVRVSLKIPGKPEEFFTEDGTPIIAADVRSVSLATTENLSDFAARAIFDGWRWNHYRISILTDNAGRAFSSPMCAPCGKRVPDIRRCGLINGSTMDLCPVCREAHQAIVSETPVKAEELEAVSGGPL